MAGAAGTVGSLQRVPSLIILSGLVALVATMLSFAYLEQVCRPSTADPGHIDVVMCAQSQQAQWTATCS